MMAKAQMTVEEIRVKFGEVIEKIKKMRVDRVGVIDDYPIGGRNRGKCKLEVEVNKHGTRLVKTTTNKNGRWCAPKKGTYRTAGCVYVVSGEGVERDVEWLSVGSYGIFSEQANGSVVEIFKMPFEYAFYVARTDADRYEGYESDLKCWQEWIAGLKIVIGILREQYEKTAATQAEVVRLGTESNSDLVA